MNSREPVVFRWGLWAGSQNDLHLSLTKSNLRQERVRMSEMCLLPARGGHCTRPGPRGFASTLHASAQACACLGCLGFPRPPAPRLGGGRGGRHCAAPTASQLTGPGPAREPAAAVTVHLDPASGEVHLVQAAQFGNCWYRGVGTIMLDRAFFGNKIVGHVWMNVIRTISVGQMISVPPSRYAAEDLLIKKQAMKKQIS